MRCQKAKKMINGYAELDRASRRDLDSHIAGCPSCQKELELHKASVNLFKQAMAFEEGNISWAGFVDQLPLGSQGISWFGLIKQKLSNLIQLISTPLWGPVPASVFSLILILAVGFGAYSTLTKREALVLKNIVVYDKEYLSSLDDGEKTVYLVSQR